jgi:putative oxidoreductase
MLDSLFHTDPSYASLALRLALAVVIFPHGAQKVLGWFGGYGLKGTLGYFSSIGVPKALALLAIAAEFLGPIGLVLGLGTRVAALGIGAVMIVAALTQHRQNGFFMNWFGNQKGEGYEFHILAAAIALVLVLTGAGAFSLDLALSGQAAGFDI